MSYSYETSNFYLLSVLVVFALAICLQRVTAWCSVQREACSLELFQTITNVLETDLMICDVSAVCRPRGCNPSVVFVVASEPVCRVL